MLKQMQTLVYVYQAEDKPDSPFLQERFWF